MISIYRCPYCPTDDEVLHVDDRSARSWFATAPPATVFDPTQPGTPPIVRIRTCPHLMYAHVQVDCEVTGGVVRNADFRWTPGRLRVTRSGYSLPEVLRDFVDEEEVGPRAFTPTAEHDVPGGHVVRWPENGYPYVHVDFWLVVTADPSRFVSDLRDHADDLARRRIAALN